MPDVPFDKVQDLLDFLGHEARLCKSIEITPLEVVVTLMSLDDNGKIHLTVEGEVAVDVVRHRLLPSVDDRLPPLKIDKHISVRKAQQ